MDKEIKIIYLNCRSVHTPTTLFNIYFKKLNFDLLFTIQNNIIFVLFGDCEIFNYWKPTITFNNNYVLPISYIVPNKITFFLKTKMYRSKIIKIFTVLNILLCYQIKCVKILSVKIHIFI